MAGAGPKIWLAEAVDGKLVRLENGRSREQIAEHLIEEAGRDPRMVVGLDFAFSLPAWFLEQRDLASAHELWALADREGDAWLAACLPPFWGRGRTPRPDQVHFRRTELDVPVTAGIRPKSVFQIGGAGAVGTGSLRGMRHLADLADAGFAIWPFDDPRLPTAVEIYPRALTGPVLKSRHRARREYLERRFPDEDAVMRERAAGSEDAFDAAVSALVMARHRHELADLPSVAPDSRPRLEGAIWTPRETDVTRSIASTDAPHQR